MRTIILAMMRRPVAQGLIAKLSAVTGIRAVYEPDYAKAADVAGDCGADTVLFEVAESGQYVSDYCLALCNRLRSEAAGCRLLLLCPESDELCVSAAMRGRIDGLIDDFLFYDASTEFLVSKLLTA